MELMELTGDQLTRLSGERRLTEVGENRCETEPRENQSATHPLICCINNLCFFLFPVHKFLHYGVLNTQVGTETLEEGNVVVLCLIRWPSFMFLFFFQQKK